MKQQYRHPAYGIVTMHRWMSSHCTIMTAQGLKSVAYAELELIESTPEPDAPDMADGLAAQIEAEQQAIKQVELADAQSTLVNLNAGSATVLNKHIPFIGQKQAKQIVTNRPKPGGYSGFSEFRDLNSKLFDNEDAWSAMESAVRFD